MTVRVEKSSEWLWRGNMWGHLLADSLDELHNFAKKLGLKKAWFQDMSKSKFPHYDITESKRLEAIKLGAVVSTRQEIIDSAYKLRNEHLSSLK